MTLHRFLKLLRIFYQGLQHITAGLRKEIDEVEKEIEAEQAKQSTQT